MKWNLLLQFSNISSKKYGKFPPSKPSVHAWYVGCAKIDCEILLHNVWQEVEYWFDVAEATRGADVELY